MMTATPGQDQAPPSEFEDRDPTTTPPPGRQAWKAPVGVATPKPKVETVREALEQATSSEDEVGFSDIGTENWFPPLGNVTSPADTGSSPEVPDEPPQEDDPEPPDPIELPLIPPLPVRVLDAARVPGGIGDPTTIPITIPNAKQVRESVIETKRVAQDGAQILVSVSAPVLVIEPAGTFTTEGPQSLAVQIPISPPMPPEPETTTTTRAQPNIDDSDQVVISSSADFAQFSDGFTRPLSASPEPPVVPPPSPPSADTPPADRPLNVPTAAQSTPFTPYVPPAATPVTSSSQPPTGRIRPVFRGRSGDPGNLDNSVVQ